MDNFAPGVLVVCRSNPASCRGTNARIGECGIDPGYRALQQRCLCFPPHPLSLTRPLNLTERPRSPHVLLNRRTGVHINWLCPAAGIYLVNYK